MGVERERRREQRTLFGSNSVGVSVIEVGLDCHWGCDVIETWGLINVSDFWAYRGKDNDKTGRFYPVLCVVVGASND